MASAISRTLAAARVASTSIGGGLRSNAVSARYGASFNRPQPEAAARCLSNAARPNEKDRKFRVHAVSLYHGDYTDPEDEDDGAWDDKEAIPNAKSLVDPKDVRRMDEEEESTWWLYDGTEESRDALATMRLKEAQKQRWIENASPPIRVSEIDERGRAYGRGSRKTAQARVWIQPGQGEIVVNRKDFVTYFPRESDREHILGPFVASQTCGQFDVTAVVKGGGLTGQAGAIRLGLARALEKYNPDYRPPMKRHGFMTRDPRMVERKKVGRVKARKSPQWVRR
eukprot:scaffold87397_cov70-Cyclotella_meneghiniana.AAC.16